MELNETKIFIPKGNLKIPRRNMPQVAASHLGDLFKWLKTQGVQVRKVNKPGASLKPIQKEISVQAVERLLKTADPKLNKPFLITKDGFILDGHHRWLALLQRDRKIVIPVFQINLKAKDALRILREYPRVLFKDTNNAEYNTPDNNLKLEDLEIAMSEQERFASDLQEHLEDIDPDIMTGTEYALIVEDALNNMIGAPLPEIDDSVGSFKDFITEARKKKFSDPKERILVRGFGSVRVGDLEKMVETRMKDVDKFRKNKDWRSVLATIQNTAIIPLLESLKEIQDANE